MSVFVCTSEDMHPYECDGPGKCRYCDAERLEASAGENPKYGPGNPDWEHDTERERERG